MNNLVKKFLSFGIGNFIVLLLGFISAPITTRILNPNEMGKFSMFSTLSNLILLIALIGLDQAYMRFFYEENIESRGELLKKTLKIPILLVIIISIIILFFYKKISILLVGETSFNLIVIFIIQCFFSVVSRFSILYIRMQQKAKLYSALQVTGKVIYIISILIILNIFNDYKILVYSLVFSNIIVTIISIFIERKSLFDKRIKTDLQTSYKEMCLFGIPLVFTMTITWIFQSIDKIFIKELVGYNELGLYASAFSIIALINAVQGTFTTFWIPVANEKYKENANDTLFFEKVNKIVVIIMLLLSIILILSKDIIILLLGFQYRDAMFIFPFLVFMPVMYTISETTVIGIAFMKKTKYTIIISVISAITNIVGNIIMVPVLGAKGAAISTGISYIVFFYLRTVISRKFYKVNYSLKKFTVALIPLILLTVYASFNKVDIITFILAIVTIVIVSFCYFDTIKKIKMYVY